MKLYIKLSNTGMVTDLIEVADNVSLSLPWVLQTPEFYASWKAGNPSEAPVRFPAVPSFVKSSQIKQWLIDAEKFTQVEAAFENPALWASEKDRLKAKLRWEYEVNVNRTDSLVISFGALLGMSTQEIDQAFVEAANIP